MMNAEPEEHVPAESESTASARKVWKTPRVVVSALSRAEAGGHLSADFSIAS